MASYNCSDSSNSAYGAGDYGTCTTGQTVGAPDTGVFGQFMESGSFTIIAPLAAAIIITLIATTVIRIRKQRKQTS